MLQILEPLTVSDRRSRRHLHALTEALRAHGVAFTDLHPAVDDPSTLLACCPDTDVGSGALLRSIADLVSRRLELASCQAVRVAGYPDLIAAHHAAGDR